MKFVWLVVIEVGHILGFAGEWNGLWEWIESCTIQFTQND